jgi:hypothetical protein
MNLGFLVILAFQRQPLLTEARWQDRQVQTVLFMHRCLTYGYLSIRGVDATILCMQPKCFFYELSRKAGRLY